MADVCPKTVWIMSQVYVCSKPGVQKLKSEVQSISKVQNLGLKPKSEVCQLSETEVQSLTPKIRIWKSKIWNQSLSEVRSKLFAIIIAL